MHHHLTVDQTVFAGLEEGKQFIVAKRNPTYASGDIINVTLEGHRQQISYKIIAIDTEHVFGNYCILALQPLPINDIPESVG